MDSHYSVNYSKIPHHPLTNPPHIGKPEIGNKTRNR